MKREDLRVRINRGTNTIPVHFYDEVSDADLAALGFFPSAEDEEFDEIARSKGYVRLDVDVEAIRGLLARDYVKDNTPMGVLNFARQVLAALDEEDTDGSR